MKIYNPKKWRGVIALYAKSDSFRLLWPYLLLIFVYSLGVAYWEQEVLRMPEHPWLKNIPLLHNMLSFVISLLLVFRTNTAYDRWWEGRKLWGQLVNVSRNLAIKINAMLPQSDIENRAFFRDSIPTYADALRNHLQLERTRLSLDEDTHFDIDSDPDTHIPNQVALAMSRRAYQLFAEGKISGEQLLILNNDINQFTEICGGCERIKNTPIPYSYSNFIKRFIVFYLFTLPLGYVHQLGYFVAPLVVFVCYVLTSLELIAEEIEDPFGTDENDLPTDKMAETIRLHVNQLL